MLTTPDHGARRFRPCLSFVFCGAALLITFIRLIQFDAPLTRFVRSLNDFHIDYLHNPWLRELSDRGNQMGKGESLLVVNAGLLAAGYLLRRPALQQAGWETLVAHLVAGGINNSSDVRAPSSCIATILSFSRSADQDGTPSPPAMRWPLVPSSPFWRSDFRSSGGSWSFLDWPSR